MDDEARKIHFNEFLKGKINILVVTDVAARGIDIPNLDVSISYDLSDEKTFVHRVGRVRGTGDNYSLVTYLDVYHFFNIQETHLPDVEIGTISQERLDNPIFSLLSDFERLRQTATRGYKRCLEFRKKVSVPPEYKLKVENFKVHSDFNQGESMASKIKNMRAREIKVKKVDLGPNFRDQFYIPYSKKEAATHCSSFEVGKDDYVKERNVKERRYKTNKGKGESK